MRRGSERKEVFKIQHRVQETHRHDAAGVQERQALSGPLNVGAASAATRQRIQEPATRI